MEIFIDSRNLGASFRYVMFRILKAGKIRINIKENCWWEFVTSTGVCESLFVMLNVSTSSISFNEVQRGILLLCWAVVATHTQIKCKRENYVMKIILKAYTKREQVCMYKRRNILHAIKVFYVYFMTLMLPFLPPLTHTKLYIFFLLYFLILYFCILQYFWIYNIYARLMECSWRDKNFFPHFCLPSHLLYTFTTRNVKNGEEKFLTEEIFLFFLLMKIEWKFLLSSSVA